jgi:hypothetical protein
VDYTSIDLSRRGNSSNTNDHLKNTHLFTRIDHKLGKTVTYGINKEQSGTIEKYTTVNPLYKDTLGTRIPILIKRYSYREEHVTRTEKKAYKFPILF